MPFTGVEDKPHEQARGTSTVPSPTYRPANHDTIFKAQTPQISTMQVKQCYANGKKALAINEDGSGFAWYPSGKIAACVST